MNIYFNRTKKSHLFIRLIYKFFSLVPLSKKQKLTITLNLEWIFNRLSHEYSFNIYKRINHPQRVAFLKFLSPFLKNNFSVLDLGCNLGDNSFLVSSKVKNVLGIDYDKDSINIAKKYYKANNLNFVVGDAIDYLKDCTENFDVLMLSHILEHLEEPEKFLNHFSGMFRYIYIEVPDLENTMLSSYRNKLNLTLQYTDTDHVIEFSREGIEKIISNSKLNILASEYKFGTLKYWCELT